MHNNFQAEIMLKLAVIFLNQNLADQRGSTLRPFFGMGLQISHDLIDKIDGWVAIGAKVDAFFEAIVNGHYITTAIKAAIFGLGCFSRRAALGVKGTTSIGAGEWCCVVDSSKGCTRSQYARRGYNGNYKIHLRCFSNLWLRARVLGFDRSIHGNASVLFLQLWMLFEVFYNSFYRYFGRVSRRTDRAFFTEIIFGCHNVGGAVNSHISVNSIAGHSPKFTLQINPIDCFYTSVAKVVNKVAVGWECVRLFCNEKYHNKRSNKFFEHDLSLIACARRLGKIADAVKFRITVSTPVAKATKKEVYP